MKTNQLYFLVLLVFGCIPGGKTPDVGSRSYTEIMREQMLKGEEVEVSCWRSWQGGYSSWEIGEKKEISDFFVKVGNPRPKLDNFVQISI